MSEAAINNELIQGWKPTKRQTIALASTAKFTLFGGSRGGGKTDTAIHRMLYRHDHPKLLGLILRKNSKDLIEFILRAEKVWKHYGAKKTGSPQSGGTRFIFPNGGEVYTGHLGTPDSYEAYQGWNLTDIFIEELTHIPSKGLFEKLMGSLRSTDRSIPARFFGTTNPTGAGFTWVKEYWHIDDIAADTLFKEGGVTKMFVPANVHDNPHLALKDPEYVRYLESLPEELKRRWLYGSWEETVDESQYYHNTIKKAETAGRITTVPIEGALRTFVSFDLGVKDNMVMWFSQIHGKEVRIVHCYANRNNPIKHYSDYLYEFQVEHDVVVEKVFLPHDSAVREMTSDTLMTRREKFEELGWETEIVPRVSIADGIEKGRELLMHCWIDENMCADGLRALRHYHKEFDEKMNRYRDNPKHDSDSDYADSFRYLALALPDVMAFGGSDKIQESAIYGALGGGL